MSTEPGRRAFDAYTKASASGLEWGILNADEQARWAAVERALARPAKPATTAWRVFNEAVAAGWVTPFSEAILDLSYDHMPAGITTIVTDAPGTAAPGLVEVMIRHA